MTLWLFNDPDTKRIVTSKAPPSQTNPLFGDTEYRNRRRDDHRRIAKSRATLNATRTATTETP